MIRSRSLGSTLSSMTSKSNLEKVTGLVAGLAAGTFANNKLAKKDLNGEDAIGLSGTASKFFAPAVLTLGGLFVQQMTDNSFLKNVALGVAAAGGAGLLNAATNKTLVSLNGDADYETQCIPGMGEVTYPELPTNNDVATSMDSNQIVDESTEVGMNDTYENLNGTEEMAIIG